MSKRLRSGWWWLLGRCLNCFDYVRGEAIEVKDAVLKEDAKKEIETKFRGEPWEVGDRSDWIENVSKEGSDPVMVDEVEALVQKPTGEA